MPLFKCTDMHRSLHKTRQSDIKSHVCHFKTLPFKMTLIGQLHLAKHLNGSLLTLQSGCKHYKNYKTIKKKYFSCHKFSGSFFFSLLFFVSIFFFQSHVNISAVHMLHWLVKKYITVKWSFNSMCVSAHISVHVNNLIHILVLWQSILKILLFIMHNSV